VRFRYLPRFPPGLFSLDCRKRLLPFRLCETASPAASQNCGFSADCYARHAESPIGTHSVQCRWLLKVVVPECDTLRSARPTCHAAISAVPHAVSSATDRNITAAPHSETGRRCPRFQPLLIRHRES
jgi:hypothetical protein